MIINLGPVQDHSNFSEYPRVTTELKKSRSLHICRKVRSSIISLFNGILLSDYEENNDISTEMLVSYSILFKSNTGHTQVNL